MRTRTIHSKYRRLKSAIYAANKARNLAEEALQSHAEEACPVKRGDIVTYSPANPNNFKVGIVTHIGWNYQQPYEVHIRPFLRRETEGRAFQKKAVRLHDNTAIKFIRSNGWSDEVRGGTA